MNVITTIIFYEKKNIYFFTGKRGGFSHFVPIIRYLNKSKIIKFKIIVADMHLSNFFGKTVNEIKAYSKKLILLDRIRVKIQFLIDCQLFQKQ